MRILGCAVLCILLAACATGGPSHVSPRTSPSPDLDAFAAALDSLRTSAHIPGLSVAVVKDGKVVLARGSGFANLEQKIAATPETPYNIASVSKPVSAVVALKLVELGQLDLDRPMKGYQNYAEFCDDFRQGPGIFSQNLHCDTEPLTMRNVLSHTVNGKAGEKFLYNPAFYSWASRPMAEVTGVPFSTLVDRYVFQPAGMTRSARINRKLPLRDDLAQALAQPYHLDASGNPVPSPPPDPQGDGAAGGVISTVLDLAKFDAALDQGQLISPASVRTMMTPMRSSTSGADLSYGLGWFVQEYQGHRLVWHSGLWEEKYSALYLKVPDRHVTLILLANSDGIWWNNPLDKAEVEKSPFARAFLDRFVSD